MLDKSFKRCYNKDIERQREVKKMKKNREMNAMMTIGNALRYYRKFSGANAYIIGFVYKHKLYIAVVEEIMPRQVKVMRASTKNGGYLKLQMNMTVKNKEQLIRKGAQCLMNEEETARFLEENSGFCGVAFERLVYELNGQTPREKENVGFWVCGDINIDGIEYQVKWENAQIVNFQTLRELQNCGADYKSYVPRRGRRKAKA